eukprot:CFRG5707T1
MSSAISDYERQRNAIIQQNQEMLSSLDMPTRMSDPLLDRKAVVRVARVQPKKRKAEVQKHLPTRRSARQAGVIAETGATEKQLLALDLSMPSTNERKVREIGILPLVPEGVEENEWHKLETYMSDVNRAIVMNISTGTKSLTTSEVASQVKKWILRSDSICKMSRERIMHMVYHPTTNKRVVLSGNKVGEVGIWDVDRKYVEEEDHLVTMTYKLHNRPVTGLCVNPFQQNQIYTSSYDGTACILDLQHQHSDAFFVDDSVSLTTSVASRNENNIVYLCDNVGQLFISDMRTRESSKEAAVTIRDLHDKKITCVDSHPSKPVIVTSSLDRTACIWDLRKLSVKGQSKPVHTQTNRLSVSSAYFSPNGDRVITTNMDDTIRLWKYADEKKHETVVIKHNNQTGRWISNFRAKFIGEHHFHVGNMKRSVDIFADTSTLTRQLEDVDLLTAIPAVNDYHPGFGELVGGTYGRAHIFQAR